MTMKKRVLILCTGNSARSQMAEGLLRHDRGDRFDVKSAGTEPSRVRPEAIAVMGELGIDISGHRSKHLDEFTGQPFDYVLTVCDHANESCPLYTGTTERLHHNFQDPAASTVRMKNGSRCFDACAMKSAATCARCVSVRMP
jgi:arsenate reductase (thioredoxin)